MAKVTELVAALAAPIAEQNGCTLWDVEYVREAGQSGHQLRHFRHGLTSVSGYFP